MFKLVIILNISQIHFTPEFSFKSVARCTKDTQTTSRGMTSHGAVTNPASSAAPSAAATRLFSSLEMWSASARCMSVMVQKDATRWSAGAQGRGAGLTHWLPLAPPPEPRDWLNFSMHSSIRAGGAFLCATVTRPQNSTSNFLAKAVGDSWGADSEDAVGIDDNVVTAVAVVVIVVVVVAMEEKEGQLWAMARPLEEVGGEASGVGVTLSLRAALLPACRSVLMISGTWRGRRRREGQGSGPLG